MHTVFCAPGMLMEQDNTTGVIEVDLFSEEVDSPDHPEAEKFLDLLLDVAEEYSCELTFFEIDKGTVAFSFDSQELTAQILKILQNRGLTD